IARTFVQNNIPEELFEASLLDGCDDLRYFTRVVLPLSQAILAVLALYYAVGHWNAYFNALIYLNSRSLYPMQVFLREILIMNQIDAETLIDEELMQAKQGMADLLKYALIVVSTAPILCVYPFLQRYFVKGVMIGSVKG
nr:ABC transporter permease subunit [Clostridia bacterium]